MGGQLLVVHYTALGVNGHYTGPVPMLTLLLLAVLGAGPAGQPAFSIRIIAPRPLFLAGRCRVAAEAVDADGRPVDTVAWMSLSVDGGPQQHDARPPFAWSIDAGSDLARHRIEIVAVDREGARVTLSTLSFSHPYVEAVGVDLVLVPVVVWDDSGPPAPGKPPRGGPVRGLGREDFTVLEGGAPQPIESFSSEPMPASIAVALDNSRSMEGQLWSARKAVLDFIEEQPGYSAVSLLTFNDQVFMEQDFTLDRTLLERAAGAIGAEGMLTALNDALRVGSMHLARRPGVRVLIIFTDGEDTMDESGAGRLRTAIDAAQSADVTVFAVAFGPAALADAASAGGRALRAMTSETGGMLLSARGAGDLREAFGRLAEGLGSRYVIGFAPPEPEKGGYRSIEVRVSRPGVRVFARRGYSMRSSGGSAAD